MCLLFEQVNIVIIGLLSTLVVKELGKQFYMLVDGQLKWIVKGHLNKKKV